MQGDPLASNDLRWDAQCLLRPRIRTPKGPPTCSIAEGVVGVPMLSVFCQITHSQIDVCL